ncbi:MAG TPA: hypothetical protein VGB89_12695 [Bacteroidota bacterium]
MSKKRRIWSREDIQTLRELYEGTPVLVLGNEGTNRQVNRKPNIIVYPANTVMANGNYHAAGSKVAKQIFEKYGIAEWRSGINSQIIRRDGVTVQVFPTGAPKEHGFPKITGDAL